MSLGAHKYKHKSVVKKEIRGQISEIQHLLKLIKNADYVYQSKKKDDSEIIRDIFWTHSNSIKQLNILSTTKQPSGTNNH